MRILDDWDLDDRGANGEQEIEVVGSLGEKVAPLREVSECPPENVDVECDGED